MTTAERKPFMSDPDYVSGLRKGAGRAWVVCYRRGTKYVIVCKAHGTEEHFDGARADARALVRTAERWCPDCARDAELFDRTVVRGDLKFQLRSQIEQWNVAIAMIDVPDTHPAFLLSHRALARLVPEGSGIEIIAPRILTLTGRKGHGLRRAKRFQAKVPIARAQEAIVFLESAARELAATVEVSAADTEIPEDTAAE